MRLGHEISDKTDVHAVRVRAGPTGSTTSLPFARTPRGRIAVDERLRVLTHPHHSDVGPADPSQARSLSRLLNAVESAGAGMD